MADAPLRLPAKPSVMLAAFLLDAGRVVSADQLVDVAWGDERPASAAGLVKTYVSMLRHSLHRPGGPEVIVTRPPGYVIEIEPDQLDLHRFEALVANGRDYAARGRPVEAAAILRRALELRRGPALGGGMGSRVLGAEAGRLDEIRLGVLEERISADMALGCGPELAAELSRLVAAHPLREGLRERYMLTLYRLGRQVEALAVYRDVRQVLATELGIDPGPRLQRLHEAILRGDDSPLRSRTPERATVDAARAARPRPSQLPASSGHLAGREQELADLCARLTGPASVGPGVCTIYGRAGTGKTALALHVAHAVRTAYPDGQLYASLHGTDRSAQADPRDVLTAFLSALGFDALDRAATVEDWAALYRSALAGLRVLVVLDDAGSERQVRPLLPAAPGCATIVTSRAGLAALDGSAQLELDVLSEDCWRAARPARRSGSGRRRAGGGTRDRPALRIPATRRTYRRCPAGAAPAMAVGGTGGPAARRALPA